MPRAKTLKPEIKRFSLVAKVTKWDVDLSYHRTIRNKDWPKPTMHDVFTAAAETVFSNYPKILIGSAITVDIRTDYEYMIYHLRKDFTFRDPDSPNDFAFLKYDEYMQKREVSCRQIAGYIDIDGMVELKLMQDVLQNSRHALCP